MRFEEGDGNASFEAPEDHVADFAPGLDAICRTASGLFNVPVAFVNLVDERHSWFRGRWGVKPLTEARVSTFCNDTILLSTGEALVVTDLCAHEQYAGDDLVTKEPYARFYAGVPIGLRNGATVGTFCLLDHVPHPNFGSAEIALLHDVARSVEAHLSLSEARLAQEAEAEERQRTQALLALKERALLEDEQAIRDSERRFRLLAENTTDIVIWCDLTSTRRYVSPAAKAVLGYAPEELIGTKPTDFVHPDEAENYHRLIDDLCQEKMESVVTTQRYRRKDGTYVWLEISFSSIREEPGRQLTGYVASLRDVSDRKRIEEDLRISEERQAMALDSGSDGIWDLDFANGDMRLSGPWLTILGYCPSDVLPNASAWEALTHPDDLTKAKSLLADHLAGSIAKFECEYRLRTKAGGYVWTLARGKVVARDTQGEATRMVGTLLDITRRKEAEALIEHMALHDPLTGLANRALFLDRLGQEVGHVGRHGGCFAVLACDLDRFKNVNDTLGHTAGDRLLCRVADVLRAIVRDGDTVARLGGDEFTIILRQIDSAKEASAVADRIVSTVGEPIEIEGRNVAVGISIGIVIGTGRSPATTAEHLFRNADIALYRAKAEGRNGYRFFEPGMDAIVAERTLLEHDLRSAVKHGEFVLHYQPFVDLTTDLVRGFEALLRWRHPTRGLVRPGEFIPVAEETGLIVAIGDWALNEACYQATKWSCDLCVAVNVSAEQFKQPHAFLQTVVSALSSSRLTPCRLELEITESILIQDAEAVLACLRNLRELGVRIALDDFGTGYSSLAYLRRFPFDKIKIDQAFVREIDDSHTAAVVTAVVGLAARVGAEITAEGVETEDQRRRVREAGCTQMQGFLFSEPLDANNAASLAETSSIGTCENRLPCA